MAVLINIKDLTKSFGSQTLFAELNFGIFDGEHVGLIGPNGTGKSTLLKIIAGFDTPDSGEIITKSGLRVVYLAQSDHFLPEQSVENALEESLKKYHLESHDLSYKVQHQLNLLNLEDGTRKISSLSGGWRKRVAIACALIQEPDLLLLDEPTNHLDLEGIFWLEERLKSASFSFLVISHDRSFLRTSCNFIIELSPEYECGFLKSTGNYDKFLEQRELYLHSQQKLEEELANKARRENEWLSRGPKARTTKAKSRIEDAHELNQELANVKRLNRSFKVADFAFHAKEDQSRELIKIMNATKLNGSHLVIKKQNLKICAGKRYGLVGPNGCGKTTLMKLMAGEILPDEGQIKIANDTKILMFEQDRSTLNKNETLKQALSITGGDSVLYQGRPIHIITWAKKFLFKPEQLESPVSTLSGGEQARILISRLMLEPCDILLLDEPTNDLDIQSLEMLESALIDFAGAVVLVSHDRSLMQNVATHILAFEGDGELTAYADLSQWLKEQEKLKNERDYYEKFAEKSFAQKTHKPKSEKIKLTFKEQFDLDNMEKNILVAEEQLQAIKIKIQDNTDHEKIASLYESLQESEATVQNLYERWSFLEEKSKLAKS